MVALRCCKNGGSLTGVSDIVIGLKMVAGATNDRKIIVKW